MSLLLDLGMRCNQLFKTSETHIKQKLLKFLLSNVELYDKTLSYTVINPYKSIQELNKKPQGGAENNGWCTKAEVTQTISTLIYSATEFQDDYAFQELVEDLQLSGELFAV